jgi:hypothetical protein
MLNNYPKINGIGPIARWSNHPTHEVKKNKNNLAGKQSKGDAAYGWRPRPEYNCWIKDPACIHYVEGDNHPLPPRSSPESKGNHPSSPRGSGGGGKKPP